MGDSVYGMDGIMTYGDPVPGDAWTQDSGDVAVQDGSDANLGGDGGGGGGEGGAPEPLPAPLTNPQYVFTNPDPNLVPNSTYGPAIVTPVIQYVPVDPPSVVIDWATLGDGTVGGDTNNDGTDTGNDNGGGQGGVGSLGGGVVTLPGVTVTDTRIPDAPIDRTLVPPGTITTIYTATGPNNPVIPTILPPPGNEDTSPPKIDITYPQPRPEQSPDPKPDAPDLPPVNPLDFFNPYTVPIGHASVPTIPPGGGLVSSLTPASDSPDGVLSGLDSKYLWWLALAAMAAVTIWPNQPTKS